LETIVKKLYEAMFLVDSAEAADWDAVITTIKNILEKAEAEIVSIKKWDERKLAYEINGKTRGTYILCYFRAEGGRIQDIERDVQLSERIMRVLILSAEHITQEDIERDPILQKDSKTETQRDTPVTRAEKHGQKITQAETEKTEAKKVTAREAEESEQSAPDKGV
jgi:small subunit ribosomal protein S6